MLITRKPKKRTKEHDHEIQIIMTFVDSYAEKDLFSGYNQTKAGSYVNRNRMGGGGSILVRRGLWYLFKLVEIR